MSKSNFQDLMDEYGEHPCSTADSTYREFWRVVQTPGWDNKPHRYFYDALQEALVNLDLAHRLASAAQQYLTSPCKGTKSVLETAIHYTQARTEASFDDA